MTRFFTNFINDESGQDLVEYALLLSMLTLLGVAAIGTLSGSVTSAFGSANTKISGS